MTQYPKDMFEDLPRPKPRRTARMAGAAKAEFYRMSLPDYLRYRDAEERRVSQHDGNFLAFLKRNKEELREKGIPVEEIF